MIITKGQGKPDSMLDHTHKILVQQTSTIVDIALCWPCLNVSFGEVDE